MPGRARPAAQTVDISPQKTPSAWRVRRRAVEFRGKRRQSTALVPADWLRIQQQQRSTPPKRAVIFPRNVRASSAVWRRTQLVLRRRSVARQRCSPPGTSHLRSLLRTRPSRGAAERGAATTKSLPMACWRVHSFDVMVWRPDQQSKRYSTTQPNLLIAPAHGCWHRHSSNGGPNCAQ